MRGKSGSARIPTEQLGKNINRSIAAAFLDWKRICAKPLCIIIGVHAKRVLKLQQVL